MSLHRKDVFPNYIHDSVVPTMVEKVCHKFTLSCDTMDIAILPINYRKAIIYT